MAHNLNRSFHDLNLAFNSSIVYGGFFRCTILWQFAHSTLKSSLALNFNALPSGKLDSGVR